jgi:hypothetical protein
METMVSELERVRTHSATNNQPQTANQKEKIPGGCIGFVGSGKLVVGATLVLKVLCKHLLSIVQTPN